MKKILVALILIPFWGISQNNNDNIIKVKGVDFIQVANALLDSGYYIEKKDSELLTIKTEAKQYPQFWNAMYTINIRIKDSTAYISGTFTAPPDGSLFKDETITCLKNKKGILQTKSLSGYAFSLLDTFAKSLKGEISYLKQ